MSEPGEPAGPTVSTGLSQADLAMLVEPARRARLAAYAPYSGYVVGAAVLAADGDGNRSLHVGCNVENAMYGATVCAERVAIWSAVAAGATRVLALAVVTPGRGTPCGTCRQVLFEFAEPDTPVILAGPEGPPGDCGVLSLAELLPHAWGAQDLADGDLAEES